MAVTIPLDILIPVALVVLILVVVTWILFSKNRKLYRRLVLEKKRFSLYKEQIEFLKNSTEGPRKDFFRLSQVVRAFFKEYFNLDYSLTYLELSKEFKKQEREDYSKFCEMMSNVNYVGEKKPEDVKGLIDTFTDILDKY